MKRAEILEAARVCVCGEREQDYGTPENNFETIGLLWGVYLRAAHPELARVMAVNHITAKDVAAMMHEINQQCLEADKRFSLDLDTMVIWTLYQCYGWREKRLHDFYLAMAKEHRRMREFYEMDDLYPERYKLKEKGIDIEKWQEEVLNNDP